MVHQRISEHHLPIRESNGWETRQQREVKSSSIRRQPRLVPASLPSWCDKLTLPDCAVAVVEVMARAWPHYRKLIKILKLISSWQIGCLIENNCMSFKISSYNSESLRSFPHLQISVFLWQFYSVIFQLPCTFSLHTVLHMLHKEVHILLSIEIIGLNLKRLQHSVLTWIGRLEESQARRLSRKNEMKKTKKKNITS